MRNLFQIIALLFMELFSAGCSKQHSAPATLAPREIPRPIDIVHWKETPCIRGNAATEADIAAGRAVFSVAGTNSKPIDIKLPRCAIFSDQQTGPKVPVIVVQAEEASGVKTAGYRLLSGAEGICTLSSLELLDGPDHRFK